ncbi:MAG: hypothetical protein LJE66_08620 [Desulfobacterales bacterium]|jgi:predicted NodU family carbamoyl transferase|nr:hypothetical protein [Desulfobacterales bacterium]
MKIIRPGLFAVLKRFPKHKDNAKQLFRESDKFQTMCEDFESCIKALDHWNRSKEEIAAKRRAEYAAIIQELEEEILQKLYEFRH